MNNGGWVVGTTSRFNHQLVADTGRIVLWRNGRAPLDLGPTVVPLSDRQRLTREPFDINENGVIALTESTWHKNRRWHAWIRVGMSGLLWHHGTMTRLKGTAARSWATVTAINDRGLAVGSIAHGIGSGDRPVVWRHGTLRGLPLPPRTTEAYAYDVSNRGLVVGRVGLGQHRNAWWWRLGGGHGPLHKVGRELAPAPEEARLVDDHDRILGRNPARALWPGPRDRARRFDPPFDITSLTGERGYVAGRTFPNYEGTGVTEAYIGRTTTPPRFAELPRLPGTIEFFGSPDVGLGVNAYAPNGGVTVGGTLKGQATVDGTDFKAVLWTCAQTYLP